jgi:hypothetical protein
LTLWTGVFQLGAALLTKHRIRQVLTLALWTLHTLPLSQDL